MPDQSPHWRVSLWHRVRKYLAVGLLVFGVVVGLITVLLPFTELYQGPLERFLSKQWHRTVTLGQLTGRWRGTGPEFEIRDLRISGSSQVTIDQAKLKLNIYKYLWPGGSNGLELVVNSAALELAAAGEEESSATADATRPVSPQIIEQLMASGSLLIENLAFKLSPSWQEKFSHLLQEPLQTALQVQQDKNQRAIQLSVTADGLVKKATIMAVTDKRRQVLKDARWYVDLEDFHLAGLKQLNPRIKWPASLVDGKFWFTTRHGRLVEGFALARLVADRSQAATLETNALSGHLRLEFAGDPDGKHWQARLRIQNLETRDLTQDQVNLLIARDDNRLRLQADVLDIAMLHNLLVTFGLPGLPDNGWEIAGVLHDVTIEHDLQQRRPVTASGTFERIDVTTPVFSATNLAGQLRLQDDEIRLLVDSDNGQLVIPRLLRRPVKWSNLVLLMSSDLQSENPDVRIPHLWCDCEDMDIDAMARLTQADGLRLNLASQLSAVKVRSLYKYWPAGIWKEKLINWLDNALQGGTVTRGGIAYLGQTSRFPFADHSGEFLARAQVQDMVLQYEPDWPKLRDINAHVTFRNRGMLAQVSQARTVSSRIVAGQATIKDFKQDQLAIAVSATGRDNHLIDFLRASELGKKWPVLQENIRFRGRSDVDLRLALSLKPGTKKPVRPFGSVHLKGVDFSLGGFQLADLRGDVALRGTIASLENIKGRFLDNPATLSGSTQWRDQQPPVVDLRMHSLIRAASVANLLGAELPLSGESEWDFAMTSDSTTSSPAVATDGNQSEDILLHFSGESDLQGLSVDLPLPLRKAAPAANLLRFDCDHPCLSQPWQVRYGQIFSARVRWLADAAKLAIERLLFGATDTGREKIVADTPIGGEIDTLDLDGWLAVLAHRSDDKGLFQLPDGEYRFHIKRGIFMSRLLQNVSVRVRRESAAWRINLSGPDIEGEVVVADDARQRGIVVQLEKLNWPEVSHFEGAFPVSENTDKGLPALHVWVKDFTYQGIPLGEMRLEARPVAGGMKVEKFESRSRWITLNATGDWLRQPDEGSMPAADADGAVGESRFHIVMVSDDLGRFLQSIGYDSPIKGGQTVIEMHVNWPGQPARFSFDRLSGELTVRIGPGEVTDAKPGIGRVFGLLNLTNLPRRLILDFADVLSQGLRFEAMKGHFRLRNGQARTDDFEVLYSGARIRVTGRMDLVNQTYDQTVTVNPKVGQILPTLGAIAGGPAGAAAGFFMQGVLHGSLKKSGKLVYHVSGPWDNPVITLVETDKTGAEAGSDNQTASPQSLNPETPADEKQAAKATQTDDSSKQDGG